MDLLKANFLCMRRCLAIAVSLAVGCTSTGTSPSKKGTTSTSVARASSLPAAATEPSAPSSSAPATEMHVSILKPPQLRSLESKGFSLGMLVEGKDARTTAELSALPGHGSIFDYVKKDFADVRRRYPDAIVSSVQGARLFEAKFFDSPDMSFALSGVFNRLDRRGFYGEGCGEIRFVYRLGYVIEHAGAPMKARLPVTINVVFDVAGDNCQDIAREWLAPAQLRGEELVTWMQSTGALSLEARKRWSLKAVETNMQTLRFQSTMHPKMAGHIEYLLRVFEPVPDKPGRFAPAPLENTPDVAALRRNRKLRTELLSFLRRPEVLQGVDKGTFRLPDKFLARRAMSVSPRGFIRLANRPFKQLFAPAEFSDLDLAKHKTISSPVALIRRLDAASCMGCHQSRSIAGFHNLGDEPDPSQLFSTLYSGVSPHLRGDLARRHEYVTSVAAGASPSEFRPFPERQGVPTGADAPCGLGDPGFASWTCEDGLRCEAIEDTEVGVCGSEAGGIGDACQYGVAKSGRKPLADRIESINTYPCGRGQEGCFENIQAASQGMCFGRCGEIEGAGSTCGEFLDIDGFQRCLRRQGTYAHCSDTFVYPLALRECDETHACRSDYVCTKTKAGESGACVPTYFLFQLRTDGFPFRR